ncbi:MAG: periplasmic heavy metal sensor [Alphaproteobacteria bacterium]|nr:MAG: periplasmic heavy metal sensor [Alphaproteobacteria bacterium]
MSRRMKILIAALSLSLAANLFALGYWLGGHRWSVGHHHRGADAMLGEPSFAMMRTLAAHLTPAEKRQLHARLQAIKETKKAQIDDMHAILADIGAQLRAPSVDRDRLLASYDALRRLGEASRQPFIDVVTDTLATMDAERRRAFLDELQQRHRAHGHHPPPPPAPDDQPPL